jgi:hypothetical protein
MVDMIRMMDRVHVIFVLSVNHDFFVDIAALNNHRGGQVCGAKNKTRDCVCAMAFTYAKLYTSYITESF